MDTGREAAMSDGDTLKISSDCQSPMAANLRDYDLLHIDARRLTRDCVSRQLATHLPELSIESATSAADLTAGGVGGKRYGVTVLHTHMTPVDDPAVASQMSLLGQIM